MKSNDIELIKDGKRVDGRGLDELRKPFKITLGVLSEANGSAYVEWGKNKVVVAVYGPKKVLPRHLEDPKKAIIKCMYVMTTFSSLEEHGRMGPSRRSTEISKVVREALENIVLLHYYPSTMIEVFMVVLQADGGTRVASLTGAIAALIDAGIPLRTVGGAISMGKAGGALLTDIGKEEDNYGEADVPLAMTKDGEIILLQMDGMLTKEEFKQLLDRAESKINNTIIPEIRRAVEEKYAGEITKRLYL